MSFPDHMTLQTLRGKEIKNNPIVYYFILFLNAVLNLYY